MQLYAFKKTVLTLLLTAFGVASFPQSYYSVFVATDRHAETEKLQNVVTQARDYVVQTYNDSLSAVVHGGDLVGSGGGNNPSGSLNTVNAEFLGKLTNLTNSDIYYTWGSHDANMEKGNTNGYLVSSGVVTRDMSGAVDLDGKAWLWGIDYNEMTNYNTATSGAAAFTNWVNGLPSDDHRAIIIMSHVPMHYRRGDNHGAVTWLTAINEAASDKDIVFLWGHNHTGSTTNDSNHAYVAVGGTVTPEASSSKGEPADGGGPGGGSGSGTAGTPVTIQFTYMNAGYITTGTIHGWNGSSITVTNDSIIIEDDYNSELRYSGLPVPALQGFDRGKRVIYMGSFSSTLFPAVRISYMVLPLGMLEIYKSIRDNYDQTCSKTEQLTLALFMQKGFYQTNLRKIRNLYSRKLQEVLDAISESDRKGNFVTADSTGSGINLILRINTRARVIKSGIEEAKRMEDMQREIVRRLIHRAASIGLRVRSVEQLDTDGHIFLLFYYSQIPIPGIRKTVSDMIDGFKADVYLGGLTMPSVYEVVRLRNGRPMFLPEHYERLEASLGSLGLLTPFTYEELSYAITEMADENKITDHNLKIEVDVSGFSVICMSPTHYPAPELYDTGVKTDILFGERKNPNVKMMDRELRDAADKAIRDGGLFEVFLVDRNGMITEGSRSNVFFIKDGEVYTPPAGQVLKGVTRLKIIDIINEMKAEGLTDLHEEELKAEDAENCDAAFISGTSPGVLPVASMGGAGFDVKDPVMLEIMKRYNGEYL